jgi:hypothetical protein
MGEQVSGLLNFPDGQSFAIGAMPYSIGGSDETAAGRLVIKLSVENVPIVAAVDTGAPYLICQPELARPLGPYLADPAGEADLYIRGARFRGRLYLLSVTFRASQGDDPSTLATVFVPQLDPWQVWEFPSFIGLTGMLDRMRFAVDPDASLFYFGPLSET